MSYILDALKKAEAEREGASPTEGAPGSFTAAASVAGGDGFDAPLEAAGRGGPALAWVVAGFAMALVTGLLAWMFLGGRTGAGSEAVVVADAAAPAQQTPPPPLPEPMPVEPSPPETAIEPAPLPAAQDEWREPPVVALPEPTPPPVATRPALRPPVPAPAPPRPQPAERRAAPVEASRVYALQELPESIRRELPQMSVGGAMYSEHPASRMLILNGQPFHEGSQPALNLTLERINLKSAVLNYKGYRYSISY